MAGAEPASRAYGTTVKALLALALVLCCYPLIRAFFDFEIDYNEGWNAFFQQRAVDGLPLYSGLGPTLFNNYPPLSFYVVGAFGEVTGDPVLAGRLVSIAALGVVALASGYAVSSAGGTRCDAGLAVATCLLLFDTFATDYLGMNDPNMLGLAFMTTAVAVHFGAADRPERAGLTALLLVLGMLTKHNLILLPILIACDVLLHGSKPSRIAFFAVSAALSLTGLALIWLIAGEAFFTQLLAGRTWDVARAFLFTTEIVGRYQAPLALVAIGLVAARRSPHAKFVLVWLAGALALGSYFAGGAGTDINVYFEVTVALAVGAGLTLREWRARGGTARTQAAVALALNAGVLFAAPLALGRFGVDAAGDMAERQSAFAADAAYLRAIPGPAVCESLLLCLRAGKPIAYDSFNANQAMLTGRLPRDMLTGLIRKHAIAVVQVSSDPQQEPGTPPGSQAMPARFVNFEDDVFDVLDREYRIDRVGLSGRFYVPRDATPTRLIPSS